MTSEPMEIKVARIEEGIVRLHQKADNIARGLEPTISKVSIHHEKIRVLGTNQLWIIGILGLFGLGAMSGFIHIKLGLTPTQASIQVKK